MNALESKTAITNKLTAYQLVAEDMKVKFTEFENKRIETLKSLTNSLMEAIGISDYDFFINKYNYSPNIRLNYEYEWKGKTQKPNHDIEIYCDRNWETNEVQVKYVSWFSTSEKPTKQNRLVEYLKIVSYLNEQILNDNVTYKFIGQIATELIIESQRINKIFDVIKSLKEQLKKVDILIENYGEDISIENFVDIKRDELKKLNSLLEWSISTKQMMLEKLTNLLS